MYCLSPRNTQHAVRIFHRLTIVTARLGGFKLTGNGSGNHLRCTSLNNYMVGYGSHHTLTVNPSTANMPRPDLSPALEAKLKTLPTTPGCYSDAQ